MYEQFVHRQMLAAVFDILQISNQRGDSGKLRVWKKPVNTHFSEATVIFYSIFVHVQYLRLLYMCIYTHTHTRYTHR